MGVVDQSQVYICVYTRSQFFKDLHEKERETLEAAGRATEGKEGDECVLEEGSVCVEGGEDGSACVCVLKRPQENAPLTLAGLQKVGESVCDGDTPSSTNTARAECLVVHVTSDEGARVRQALHTQHASHRHTQDRESKTSTSAHTYTHPEKRVTVLCVWVTDDKRYKRSLTEALWSIRGAMRGG